MVAVSVAQACMSKNPRDGPGEERRGRMTRGAINEGDFDRNKYGLHGSRNARTNYESEGGEMLS